MGKNFIKFILFLATIMLLVTLLAACSDNKKSLVIIEKGDTVQMSFAKSIINNDEKSVKFIDENGREQYIAGDYVTISAIKSADENLIIVNNNGILSLIFPETILTSSPESVTYIDEEGKECTVEGEITVIQIR